MIKQLPFGAHVYKYSSEQADTCGQPFKPVDEFFLNRMGSALPITYFNKSHYADMDGRLAERRPPQLTRGHANNLGQQGGDDCSESKIDPPIYSYAHPPPGCSHFLLLLHVVPY